MKIALSRLHYPVTALGPGRRIGLWAQGCSIGCPGCISRDTWPALDDSRVEIAAVVQWCRDRGGDVDGITISGGEPFEQPQALNALLIQLDTWRRGRDRAIDFLCYSGQPWKRLYRDFPEILTRLDAIIPEPFVEALPTDAPWRGSANQPLIPLSALGRSRYAHADDRPAARTMQVTAAGGNLWVVGIPRRGDLARLRAAGKEHGIGTETTSWDT